MPSKIPDAGELRDKVKLLELRPKGENAWAWAEVRKAYAKATPTARVAIFSNTGVGSREVEFILRRQRFTLGNAIEWRGGFCLPTSVEHLGPGHLLVKAARVEPAVCAGVERDTEREIVFPAVVTERYMGHTQAEPMAQNAVGLVLVVPKAIRLKLGSLVTLPDAAYWVKIPHELDEFKNEIEIERTVEP